MVKKIIDYEFMSAEKLDRINKRTKLMVIASSVVFSLVSGIACLFSYSIDPVLALGIASFSIGIYVLFMVIFFVYGKIVFLLKVLTEVED